LSQFEERFLESYAKLIPFQAWKEYVLIGRITGQAMAFFVEAQNDALVSHLLARQGMWRPSLQSLRSCVENVLVALYYADHPVELRLWEQGKHKTGFTSLTTYFEGHPDFAIAKDEEITGLPALQQEYAHLSKAVHGSSKSFMMSEGGEVPNVWIPEEARLGQWLTRQRKTLEALNLILIIYNQEKLKGTSHSYMRTALSKVIGKPHQKKLKSIFQIHIPSS
jgi:hypothetical protein